MNQQNETASEDTSANDAIAADSGLVLTAVAQAKVRESIAADQDLAGKPLRVYVEGGGCSGFQYGFAFDQKRAGDQAFAMDGFEVVVDPQSLYYLKGSQVDYVEGWQGAGFTVSNPNSKGSCGCGESFHV